VNILALTDISQFSTLEASDEFDLALGYVGPDRRSIANLLEVLSHTRLMWVFTGADCTLAPSSSESIELMRRKVRANLCKLDTAINKIYGPEVETELRELLESPGYTREEPLRIFVEVSAFPRRVLASILNIVREVACGGVNMRLTISYRLAVFSKPREQSAPPNKRVAPVHPELAGWPKLPGLPVHLIVGLGYEQGKALGAVEYIQPAFVTLFSPQSPEPRFAQQVASRNKPLLDGIPPSAIFEYQVLEPAVQMAQLSSMLASLVDTRRPVLLPFGPKIFFAVCVLLSFGFPEVSVWHVSGEEEESVANLKASDSAIHMSLTLAALS